MAASKKISITALGACWVALLLSNQAYAQNSQTVCYLAEARATVTDPNFRRFTIMIRPEGGRGFTTQVRSFDARFYNSMGFIVTTVGDGCRATDRERPQFLNATCQNGQLTGKLQVFESNFVNAARLNMEVRGVLVDSLQCEESGFSGIQSQLAGLWGNQGGAIPLADDGGWGGGTAPTPSSAPLLQPSPPVSKPINPGVRGPSSNPAQVGSPPVSTRPAPTRPAPARPAPLRPAPN